MLQIAIDDAGAFLAGADLAFEDFVGVGRAPVRGWRKGGAGFFSSAGVLRFGRFSAAIPQELPFPSDDCPHQYFFFGSFAGKSSSPARAATFLWRSSNEAKAWHPISKAAATCQMSAARASVPEACFAERASARR